MGMIRFALALSVAVWHLGGANKSEWIINGYFSVILFFIISGFYMSLVINSVYSGV